MWWGARVNNVIVDILTWRQLDEPRVQGKVWTGGINLGILSSDMVFKAMGLSVSPVGTKAIEKRKVQRLSLGSFQCLD